MKIKTGDEAGLMAACMRNKKFRFIAKGYSFVIFLSICSLSHAQKESILGDSSSIQKPIKPDFSGTSSIARNDRKKALKIICRRQTTTFFGTGFLKSGSS